MKPVIDSDATPVIAFSKIGKLKLLQQIVGEIIIPEEVSRKLFAYKKADVHTIKNSKWIKVEKVASRNDVELLLTALDRGEAEVLVLSKERKADLVFIDELSARKVALMMGLSIIGTVGLLIHAKKRGLLKLVKPI